MRRPVANKDLIPTQYRKMQTTIHIQKAGSKQYDAICQLLSAAQLPIEDINPLPEHFFIAVEADEIVAVTGMDKYGNAGLLRSVLVQPAFRNSGVAATLLSQMFSYAKEQGIVMLYLITNTAEKYFEKKGFKKIAREAVPATVLQSKEFNGLCPSGSAIMQISL